MQYSNVNWRRWPFIFCIVFIIICDVVDDDGDEELDDDDDDDASIHGKQYYSCKRMSKQRTQIVAKITGEEECTWKSTKTNHKTNYHSPFHWNDWRPYYYYLQE